MAGTQVRSDPEEHQPEEHQPAATGIYWEPLRVPYATGPQTTGQLVALSHLNQIATAQGMSAPSLLKRLTAQRPWPLYLVLAVQFGLSLRLVWANTAFQDEALYLWAGHMEWAHWLHHAPIPDFATYFSGAPVVYPPLGAVFDSLGGLAAARLLSMGFMLAATCLLWGVTRRLYDRRAAHFAAALFAGLATCQYLGAFATYDAMALFLLTLATWLTVRARGDASEFILVMASMAMATADAAKYAAALWNPIIIALAALTAEHGGILHRSLRGGRLALYTGTLIALALRVGGHQYVAGILFTTVARASGQNSALGVLSVSGGWVGTVLFLSVIGVIVTFFRTSDWRVRLVAVVLTVAIFLAPAEQARIHTIISLFKHVGFGAWFAAAVGGYALASLTAVAPSAKVTMALRVGTLAVVAAGVIGTLLATTHFHDWPPSTAFVAAMRKPLYDTSGPVVANEETYILDYYLPNVTAKHAFANPGYFGFTDPETHKRLHGNAAYIAAIENRYFGIVALPFDVDLRTDIAIKKAIVRYGGYRLVASIPYLVHEKKGTYRIWVRVRQVR